MNSAFQRGSLSELDREDSRSTTKTHATVAIYPSHIEAEVTLKELQGAGFETKRFWINGRDY